MITQNTVEASAAKASKALSYYLSIVDNAKVSEASIAKASAEAKAWAVVSLVEAKAVKAVELYEALVKAHGIKKVIYIDAHMQYIINASEAVALAMLYKLIVSNMHKKPMHDILSKASEASKVKVKAYADAKYKAVDASRSYYKAMMYEYSYRNFDIYLCEYINTTKDISEAIDKAFIKQNAINVAYEAVKAEVAKYEAELAELKKATVAAKAKRYTEAYYTVKLAKAEAIEALELSLCKYNEALEKLMSYKDDTVVAEANAKADEATDYTTLSIIWAEAKAKAEAFHSEVYNRYINAKGLAKVEASFTYTAWAEVADEVAKVKAWADIVEASATIAKVSKAKYNEALNEANEAEAEVWAVFFDTRQKLDNAYSLLWAKEAEAVANYVYKVRLYHYRQLYNYYNKEVGNE